MKIFLLYRTIVGKEATVVFKNIKEPYMESQNES
jgi:hypothetical protein